MDTAPSRKRAASASPERNPHKKLRAGITATQKQALIDNLQLEITERARRLRAQYNIQAQQLRSRLEMRLFRVPYKLRKMTMGDLLEKSTQPQQPPAPPKSSYVPARPPPVPAKDSPKPMPKAATQPATQPAVKPATKPIARKPVPERTSSLVGHPPVPERTSSLVGRVPVPERTRGLIGHKRLNDAIVGSDKENQDASADKPSKKARVAPTTSKARSKAPAVASQVLSPTSSNTRVVQRKVPVSPVKSMISRPVSPVKTTAGTSATRTAAATRTATTRPATTRTATTRKAAAPPPTGRTLRKRG